MADGSVDGDRGGGRDRIGHCRAQPFPGRLWVDSVIELASSGVLLWRLNVELRWGMDRASTWIDIALGLLIAGPLAAWLPKEFWQAFFLSADPLGSKIVGPLIGPIVAIVSFVCSVGNVPLAAVLWNGGISFGAVIAFLFADLIVLPILDIYRRYYGLKIALLLLGVSYAAMAGAAYIVELIFGVASAPTSRPQVSVTMWRLRPLTFLAAS
jgi:uncharacterized membrane protein YraQ (UPF0718 family)